MTAPVIPLSYLVRQRQLAAAQALKAWFDDPSVGEGAPLVGALNLKSWTRKSQQVAGPHTDQGWNWIVTYHFGGFDPDASDYHWGAIRTVSDPIVDHQSQTLLLDNTASADPLDVDLTRTVTLHHSDSATTEHRISVDIGSKVGAIIGGEATGGKLEAEVSSELGISDTSGRTISDGKDTTQSVSVKTTVPPAKAKLVRVIGPRLTRQSDFAVDGAIDGPFEIGYDDGLTTRRISQLEHGPRYSYEPNGKWYRKTIRFEGFEDFYAMLHGYNVDFPMQTEPLGPEHVAKIEAARRLVWSGTLTTVDEDSVEVRFVDVSDPQAAILANGIPTSRIIR